MQELLVNTKHVENYVYSKTYRSTTSRTRSFRYLVSSKYFHNKYCFSKRHCFLILFLVGICFKNNQLTTIVEVKLFQHTNIKYTSYKQL